MPFFKAGDLSKHLKKQKKFPEETAKFFALQIAMALSALHDTDVFHRDVKLENVLMQDDGYICLSEFELATE
jgi:serum/glucocorticoid-regulated kinase 2